MLNLSFPEFFTIWKHFMAVFLGSTLGPLSLFLIIVIVIFIAVDIYVFIENNKKYPFSYIPHSALSITHQKKASTPHMAGMMIFPSLFIIYLIIDMAKILRKSACYLVNKEGDIINYFFKIYKNKNTIGFLLSNAINTITIIIILKILITGTYFLVKDINASNEEETNIFNKYLLFMPLIMMAIVLASILTLICQGQTAFLYPPISSQNLSFFYSIAPFKKLYNPIVYFSHSLTFFVLLPALSYCFLWLLQKYIKRKNNIEEQNRSIRIFLYGLVMGIILIFCSLLADAIIGFNIWPLITIGDWGFNGIPSPFFLLIFFSVTRDISIIFFPLLVGGLDDIHKINKQAMTISNRVKFITFTLLGALISNTYVKPYLFEGLLESSGKFFLKKMPVGFKYLWIVITWFLRGILFNTTINAINFTDGADGLVTLSTFPFFFSVLMILSLKNIVNIYKNIADRRASYLLMDLSYNLSSMIFFVLIVIITMGIFFHFNKPKAKILLGETGSFALATTIYWVMLCTGLDLHLFLSCVMCYWQVLTSTLQRMSRLIFKRKIFPFTPFHHYLELLGYRENFILILYFSVNCLLSLLSIMLHVISSDLTKNIILWFNNILGI
jgi:phospho-N-acetylmuramoyl-pentapeptide-transferase